MISVTLAEIILEAKVSICDCTTDWLSLPAFNCELTEANPNLCEYLKQKYEYFDEVEIFNYAISNTSDYIDLYLGEGTLASSIYATKNNVTDKTVKVMSQRFSDFVNDNVCELHTSHNVLKLNIEGAELDVYEDLIETDMFAEIDLFCGHPSHDIEKVAELEPKRKRY